MILENQNTTLAFRCPVCYQSVLSGVNLFRLSGDMMRLRCPDCDQALTIVRTRDRRFRLSVPCVFCASPHNLQLGESSLFVDGLFSFPCGFTGLDIFWAGKEDEVRAAIEKSDRELEGMLTGVDREELSAMHAAGKLEKAPDPAVEHVVRFLICELDEEGKISCYCKEDGEIPLYDFQILSERVRIFCHCCGAETYLPLHSEADAERFIGIDSLELK